MGLAYEAIHPEVYPMALELLRKGEEKYFVAAKIYKQFAEKYNIPENETNTAMIDLSLSEAEESFKLTNAKDSSYISLNRENLYKMHKFSYDKLRDERHENLELRPELEVPQKIREKLEASITSQKWITVKSDGKYATLPHQYVVRHNWNNSVISFDFFCELLRQYCSVEIWKGTLENWAGRKGEYLRIGNFKYWDMGWPLEVTTVLNRENPKYKTHDEYRNHPQGEI
jgi:hypothetical protein